MTGDNQTQRASDEQAAAKKKSRLIAIEGIDGSGKGTQARILVERIRQTGRKVELISFPALRRDVLRAARRIVSERRIWIA